MFKRIMALILALICVVALASCGSSGSASSSASYYQNTAPGNGINFESSGSEQDSDKGSATTESRKIERTADLFIETLQYENSVKDLENLVKTNGGYVESSQIAGEGINNSYSTRNATYVLRIPSDKMDALLNSCGNIGNILSKNLKAVDVTQNYSDTQAHVNSLKAERTSLEELLKRTVDLNSIISLHDRLAEINTEIDKLTGSLNKIDSLVNFAVINVTLTEVKAITNLDFGQQLANTFQRSIDALVNFFKICLNVIVALLPFLIIFGAVTLIIILLVRFIGKHNKKNKNL